MHKYNYYRILISHLHVRRFLHNKYNDLLLADIFKVLGFSIVSLFVPIFLIKSGFSILAIMVFELGIFTGSIISHYIIFKFIYAWGIKKSLIVSYIFEIIFYLMLYNFSWLTAKISDYNFLIIIAIFNTIATTLYWSAHHIYFFLTTKIDSSGKKLGKLYSIPALFSIVGPFLGGLLITKTSFHLTFLVVIILMLAASLALFFTKEIKPKVSHFTIKDMFDFSQMRKNIIYFFQGFNFLACGFLFPLFLFVSAIKILSIGFIYLVANSLYSLSLYFVGKSVDIKGNKLVATIGTIIHGFSLIFRALAKTVLGFTAALSLGGFFGGMMDISLESGYYRYSYEHIYKHTINREFYLYLGRVIFLVLIIFGLGNFEPKEVIQYAIMVIGILTIVNSLIIKGDKTIISK